MKRGARYLSMVIFIMTIFLMGAGKADAAWEDMSDVSGHWAETTLKHAYQAGIMQGYGNEMQPNAAITRAELLTMLCRIMGASETANISGMQLSDDAWYKPYAAQAKYLGVIEDTVGDLNIPIHRGEAILFLVRFFAMEQSQPDTAVLSKFEDAGLFTTEEWKAAAVGVASGVLEGSEGMLHGRKSMTRAEFATMIYRVLQYFAISSHVTAPSYHQGVLVYGDASFYGTSFTDGLWFGCSTEKVSLEDIHANQVVLRSHVLKTLSLEGNTSIGRLVLASQSGDIHFTRENPAAIDTLVIGAGAGLVESAGNIKTVEVTGNHRKVVIADYTPKLIVSGSGNEVTIAARCMVGEVVLAGSQNKLSVEGLAEHVAVIGDEQTLSGTGTVTTLDIYGISAVVEESLTRGNETLQPTAGLSQTVVAVKAQDTLPVGVPLSASAEVKNLPAGNVYTGTWYVSGAKVKEEPVTRDGVYTMEYTYKYTRYMSKRSEVAFVLSSGTETKRGYEAVRNTFMVNIENYDEDYYKKEDVQRVLAMVDYIYRGNYTTEWANAHDYTEYEKEVWVNAKGYTSDTEYLIWVNLACQRTNIFRMENGGWKLIRSGMVGTGAPNTPTPVGVWKTTYKEQYGWTTGSYTVKPVVRFKGGGYAFHSRLYYPNSTTLKDPSIGFPVSAGCIRMFDEDIQFLYDYIPTGTTVVVF